MSGETVEQRTKGKDVRTSNIIAAKVRTDVEVVVVVYIFYKIKCGGTIIKQ